MSLTTLTFTEKKATRDGFGVGISQIAKENSKIIALTADLAGSLKLNDFIAKYPKRFIQCGIAEANMMGVAAGLAIAGFVPYATSFANFATGRVYDQIRQSIAYSFANVKICASHAGLTLGEDGATHQILEDIGLMKMLPQMTVIVPCDYNQTIAATKQIASYGGPVYLRFGRPNWPVFTQESDFEIGKAQVLSRGNDISIFATGHLVWTAVEAGQQLEKEGYSVEVVNIHTIKPIDEKAVITSIKKTNRALICEEHNVLGGLGETIASIAGRHHPVRLGLVGVNDSFGESGTPDQLLVKYGLDSKSVYQKALKLLTEKSA